jgi:hypothetical protein
VTYPAPINPDPDVDVDPDLDPADPGQTEQLPDPDQGDGGTVQPVGNPPPPE